MELELEVRPANSLVLVMDVDGDPPDAMDGGLVAATSTCVAIGTREATDGATTLRVVGGDGGAAQAAARDDRARHR